MSVNCYSNKKRIPLTDFSTSEKRELQGDNNARGVPTSYNWCFNIVSTKCTKCIKLKYSYGPISFRSDTRLIVRARTDNHETPCSTYDFKRHKIDDVSL